METREVPEEVKRELNRLASLVEEGMQSGEYMMYSLREELENYDKSRSLTKQISERFRDLFRTIKSVLR